MVSMSQAAKIAHVSKATIHRAIKSGRISAVRQDDGSYLIDPAELSRVYAATRGNGHGETDNRDIDETSRNGSQHRDTVTSAMVLVAELAGARQLIRSLQEQVTELRKSLEDQVEDLRRDRDCWRQQADLAQQLLTDAREAKATPPTAPAEPWWWWLRRI